MLSITVGYTDRRHLHDNHLSSHQPKQRGGQQEDWWCKGKSRDNTVRDGGPLGPDRREHKDGVEHGGRDRAQWRSWMGQDKNLALFKPNYFHGMHIFHSCMSEWVHILRFLHWSAFCIVVQKAGWWRGTGIWLLQWESWDKSHGLSHVLHSIAFSVICIHFSVLKQTLSKHVILFPL